MHVRFFGVRAYTGLYEFTYVPRVRKAIGYKDYFFPLLSI